MANRISSRIPCLWRAKKNPTLSMSGGLKLAEISQFPQRPMPRPSDDDMVEQFDLEQLPSTDEVAGYPDVGIARRWIARGKNPSRPAP